MFTGNYLVTSKSVVGKMNTEQAPRTCFWKEWHLLTKSFRQALQGMPRNGLVVMGTSSSRPVIPPKVLQWDSVWRWQSVILMVLALVGLMCVLASYLLKEF